jgi:hypothetical protein
MIVIIARMNASPTLPSPRYDQGNRRRARGNGAVDVVEVMR